MTGDRRPTTEEGKGIMVVALTYKFQKLSVYEKALDYLDKLYELAGKLPVYEKANIRGQLERVGTSIVLNIAEGSTGQTDLEQSRFLGIALRSYIETVACLDIAERRNYLKAEDIDPVRQFGHTLFVKLQALRRSISTRRRSSVSGPNNE